MDELCDTIEKMLSRDMIKDGEKRKEKAKRISGD
jgi:hypothetical protein